MPLSLALIFLYTNAGQVRVITGCIYAALLGLIFWLRSQGNRRLALLLATPVRHEAAARPRNGVCAVETLRCRADDYLENFSHRAATRPCLRLRAGHLTPPEAGRGGLPERRCAETWGRRFTASRRAETAPRGMPVQPCITAPGARVRSTPSNAWRAARGQGHAKLNPRIAWTINSAATRVPITVPRVS